MAILLVGSEGSMGKRYQALLKSLKKTVICADKGHGPFQISDMAKGAEGIIIATPTDTHYEMIKLLAVPGRKILCEKPITKNIAELKEILALVKQKNTSLQMMLQYSVLQHKGDAGDSYYNYFRHGNDGLIWDCFQIIGLARSGITLLEDSPIWSCRLNGRDLDISDMDRAYVAFVQRWLAGDEQDLSWIEDMHHKVASIGGSNG